MNNFKNQLVPLLKKNYVLKGRSKIKLLTEILSPLVVIGILLGMLYLSMIISRDYSEQFASGFTEVIRHNRQLIIGAQGGLNSYQREILNNLKSQVRFRRQGISDEVLNSYFVEFKSMKDMDAYFYDPENYRGVIGGVWFPDTKGGDINGVPTIVKYSIKVDSDHVNRNDLQHKERDDSQIYLRHYFTQIQVAVDQAILMTNGVSLPILVTAKRFPNPYTLLWQQWSDGRKMILLNTGGVFITAAIYINLFTMITNMVIEKETKILEGMKIMGLNNFAYNLSIAITSFYTLIPSTILIAIILKSTSLIHSANFFILLVILLAYSITLLLLSFILCKFFKKSKFAGMISMLIVLLLSGIGILINHLKITPIFKMITCLLSPIALSIANFSWTTKDLLLVKAIDVDSNYMINEYEIIGMLFLDILLYLILIWYLDNVVSGQFGISKPWYFFLTKSYWKCCGRKSKRLNIDSSQYDLESSICKRRAEGDSMGNFENFENSKLETTIKIRNLRKEFKTGDGLRVAVNDLTIDMYKNQIHSLLGQNGSGKSTTICMLTGLIQCTKGGAIINGFDIHRNMDDIRKSLGVCPQVDIIWEELTVLEHLEFYGALKGYENKNQRLKIEATKIANEVGLEEKLNAPAGTLSGGQKRKLCLAISFIGPNCDIIFLDEPTSGMDPTSRRTVWDFILKYKKDKTIILTTHYLEESEVLSDCISIISNGELKCSGSSLFLKNRFGVGYLLTITKKMASSTSSTHLITEIVNKYIIDGQLLSDAGTELCYRLPNGSLSKFSEFFNYLDQNKQKLSIENYGISITTMEEVFLKIISNSIESQPNFDESILKRALQTTSSGVKGGQQLKGLLVKRFTTTRKDLKSFILSVLIPLIILTGGLILYKNMRTIDIYNTVTTPMVLDMGVYGDETVTPFSIYKVDEKTETIVKQSFKSNSKRTVLVPYQKMDQYLVEHFEGSSPGALFFTGQKVDDISAFHYRVYYNKDWLHALPIYINFVDSEISKTLTGIAIETTSLPFLHLIKSGFEKAAVDINFAAIIFFIILTISAFALVSASHAGNISQERATRVKRLLYISGLKKYVYWISNLIWDYTQTAVMALFLSVIIIAVDEKFRTQFPLYISGIVLFIISIIPLSYIISNVFKFSSHGKAVGAIFGIQFGVGLLMTVTCLILRVWAIKENSIIFQNITDYIDIVFFVLSPFYCFSKILTIICNFPGITRLGENYISNYWDFKFGLLPVIALSGHCVVWISALLISDYYQEISGKFKNQKNNNHPAKPDENEDSDVSLERLRVNKILLGEGRSNDNNSDNSYPIIMKNLHKEYKSVGKYQSKIAVHNTSLAISIGQTFGLLGLNGAGKSSTLQMLSGETIPTCGEIQINGYDLQSQRKKALLSIGYCFQFDALVGLLSAREQLTLYCRIKGVNESEINETVEAFIKMMDLTAISNSNCVGYSGGNKRKVSLSIACIGNPSVVLLDEVSCGVDCSVRRFMWNCITQLKKNKAIILCTHSIPECVAVCDRLTIMKEGKLTCLGSNQSIISKFGAGYSIEVKFKKDYIDHGVELFKQSFPTSILIDDQHGLAASFEMPNPPSNPVSLSWIFSTIENTSLKSILDDYSVNQTSIEQIFIKLTKNNNEHPRLD